MGTRLKRLVFRTQYPKPSHVLFIFRNPKRIPKDRAVINVSLELSAALVDILASLNLDDAVEVIREVCRNRRLCVAWPGIIKDTTLTYATPDSPEYFQGDLSKYADTYLVTD